VARTVSAAVAAVKANRTKIMALMRIVVSFGVELRS
jgi:hypothetical protein